MPRGRNTGSTRTNNNSINFTHKSNPRSYCVNDIYSAQTLPAIAGRAANKQPTISPVMSSTDRLALPHGRQADGPPWSRTLSIAGGLPACAEGANGLLAMMAAPSSRKDQPGAVEVRAQVERMTVSDVFA